MMNLALLGFGVVGSGVYELCQSRSDIVVKRVLLRSDKPRVAHIATHDMAHILGDSSIDTVVEVMGGLHPAYEYVTAALRAGKNVVTANKALIAAFYEELIALAAEYGVALRCTAAVGGGIPWLTSLERVRRLDTVTQVGGIMNGTSNFIMDAMHRSPVDFGEILARAQALGYAEADPSADIDGDDIRRKLVISANVAFDALIAEEAIPMFGIRTVTAGDIAAFQKHGFVCKLLADAALNGDSISASIMPTLVEEHELEAAVPANFNLITYTGEAIGRQSFYGQGAGKLATASNVLQDCIDILSGRKSFYTGKMVPMSVDNSVEARPCYIRTNAPDAWLREHTAETWENGAVITAAVTTREVLNWAKAQLRKDSGCFIAAIR